MQLKRLVATDSHRLGMWYRLVSFLCWPVLGRRFSHVYIGGGFVSNKPSPEDIDVILQTSAPYGPEAFSSVEMFFLIGLENIRDLYLVDLHFWMEGAPEGLADYRTFFQYERPKQKPTGLSASRGIVKIDLSRREEIRRELKANMSALATSEIVT